MIDACSFDVDGIAEYYVVASPEAIQDLLSFVKIHTSNKTVDPKIFMERIQFHNAFCHVKPHSASNALSLRAFKKQLQKAKRWISIDAYIEAYYIAHPEKALKVLPFSVEDILNTVVDNSPWIEMFDVDKDDLIRRLRACSDHNT